VCSPSPNQIIGAELGDLANNVKELLSANNPLLTRMACYYFDQNGKYFRPLMVLLVSKATYIPATKSSLFNYIDTPISPVLSDSNTKVENRSNNVDYWSPSNGILPSQRRLAEITEMIHTASLLHDDVIDDSHTRRGVPSINSLHGNKLAILAGDYLLARASVALARLRDCEVVELLATVIADLVEGEVMQLKGNSKNGSSHAIEGTGITYINPEFDSYMEKTYRKTASLMAKSCRAATVLGGCDSTTCDIAYAYGKHLGLAFQLVDDLLDFTSSASSLGKPSEGSDMKLGLATAPVLFAAQEFPELQPLIDRRFSGEGDTTVAFNLVHLSQGLAETRELASSHAKAAADAIQSLSYSTARDALVELCENVLTRTR
jgi:hexaprenyl-diphosphate synthase